MSQGLGFKVICYYTFWTIISGIYLFLDPPSVVGGQFKLIAIKLIKISISLIWILLTLFVSKTPNRLLKNSPTTNLWYGLLWASAWGGYTCLLLDSMNPILLFDIGLIAICFSTMFKPNQLGRLLAIACLAAILAYYLITNSYLSLKSLLSLLLVVGMQWVLSLLNYILLLKQQKFSSYSQEIANEILNEISHEIRAPLQGIIGLSEALLSSWKILSDKEKYGMVKILYGNSTNLISYLSNILDKASKAHHGIEIYNNPVDLKKIIEESLLDIEALRMHKSISINSHIDPRVPDKITGDHFKIKQVIVNLLCNALKYSAPHTQIQLTIKNELATEPQEQCNIIFTISDQGIGIPIDELETIFLPFAQSSKTQRINEQGTGYGLSLAAKTIKEHGGRIWAQNNDSGGASFYFTIPYFCKAAKQTTVDEKNFEELILQIKNFNNPAKKVLIVDDDITALLSLQMSLRLLGFEVLIAYSGEKALQIANEVLIDMIFLDLLLPNINGIQVLEITRANNEYTNLPAIFLTGALDSKEGLENMKNSWYLMKPYTTNQLANIIKQVIDTIY